MIYFDNAATTAASDKTTEILIKYAKEDYFNPSASYRMGIDIKNSIEKARQNIIRKLNASDGGVVFTSGGTESDNLAMFGTKKIKGGKIIISAAEHAAVYYGALELEKRGFEISICPVDSSGKIDLNAYKRLLCGKIALISIIHVNNETGAVNDIKTLSELSKAYDPSVIFHSDGVQAFGKIPVNLYNTAVDLYSLSAHKIHGAKGTGALYYKKGLRLSPQIIGGGQENGLRSSTENVGGILAFSAAADNVCDNLEKRVENALRIKNAISENLLKIPFIKLISSPDSSSPFILTVASEKVRGEVMQHALERKEILIGTGSACASNKASKRISESLGLTGKYADGLMRISFSELNNIEEAKIFSEVFETTYRELMRYGS